MSSFTDNRLYQESIDVYKKFNVVKAILYYSRRLDHGFNVDKYDDLVRVLNLNDPELLAPKTKERPKPNFNDFIKNIDQFKSYLEIRAVLTDYYLKDSIVPSYLNIKKSLQKRGRNLLYPANVFMNDLRKAGFIWVLIPGTDKTMIIEKPVNVFKRMTFLSKMAECRKAAKDIYYIGEWNCNGGTIMSEHYTLDTENQYLLLIANRDGIVNQHLLSKVEDSDAYVDAIIDCIVSVISPPSLIVLGEKEHNKVIKVPDEYSSKLEMSDYLTKNNIPHDSNGGKSEMYELIKKCKIRNYETYKIEQILNGHGYEVMLRPRNLTDLCFFKSFLNISRHFLSRTGVDNIGTKEVSDLENLFSTQAWATFEDMLIEEENKIFNTDLKLETVIDKIFVYSQNKSAEPNDYQELKTGFPCESVWADVIIG